MEVRTKGGLATFHLLFVMEIATRRLCLAGCTPNPGELWMKQVLPTTISRRQAQA